MFPELFLTGATRDDVYLEILKVLGIAISALASSWALYLANKNRKTTDRVERQIGKRRKTVRRTDHRGQDPKITIVEDRRESPDDRERE